MKKILFLSLIIFSFACSSGTSTSDTSDEAAYHLAELDFQNFQKIKFQVDENYHVDVFSNGNTAGDANLI